MEGSFKFHIKGIDKLVNKMDYTVKSVNDGANEALREGAEVMQKAIMRHTPVDTGKAQANVDVSNVKTLNQSYKSIEVGYNSEVAYYMLFVNDGTYSKGNPKGIKPRQHVQKAKAEGDPASEAVIADLIMAIIESQ